MLDQPNMLCGGSENPPTATATIQGIVGNLRTLDMVHSTTTIAVTDGAQHLHYIKMIVKFFGGYVGTDRMWALPPVEGCSQHAGPQT